MIANSTGAAASRRSVPPRMALSLIANVPVGAYTLCARPQAPGLSGSVHLDARPTQSERDHGVPQPRRE